VLRKAKEMDFPASGVEAAGVKGSELTDIIPSEAQIHHYQTQRREDPPFGAVGEGLDQAGAAGAELEAGIQVVLHSFRTKADEVSSFGNVDGQCTVDEENPKSMAKKCAYSESEL
jgi:hypothetical protein